MNLVRLSFPTLFIFFTSIFRLEGQGIQHSLEQLKLIHAWKSSIEKDSALAYEYNYLAEGYSGQNDSLALLYIDSLRQHLPLSKWNKTEGLYLRALGKYHDRRGEFQQAVEKYTQAADYFEKIGDQTELIAYTKILKAFVLGNNEMDDECMAVLEDIRPLAEKLPNKNYLAWIHDWYGDRYFYSAFHQQDIPKALTYYLKVEELLPQVRNAMIKADNAHCLAGCYIRLGDEEKALHYRNLSLELAKANNLHSVSMAVYSDIADVYEEKGDFKKAIEHRSLALDYARQYNWIEMISRMEKNSAYTYKAAGDFENAFIHYEAYRTIEDSLSRHEVQSKYHELEAKYELEKKDFEITRLKARNLEMLIYVLGALLLGGLLFLVYYKRTNTQLRKNNQELFKKNLEIQMALTEGQNIERKRMALELHDNINAKIAATKWMLETINTPDKSPEEKKVITRLVDAMSDIYEDVRFISHNLVPKDLETKSLDNLVMQLVQNLNHNQKIHFTYAFEGHDQDMDKGLKLQCYAMIMELINNILKHSGCHHAAILLRIEHDAVNIQVRDDGKGFDPEKTGSGVGLKNLATRVQSVKGTIQYESTPGQGTTVNILIPLDLYHSVVNPVNAKP